MSGYIVALVGALAVLMFMFEALRRRRLREKYAVLWIGVGVLALVSVAWPGLLEGAARLLGITVPLNLVFFGSLLLLLVVCVQLSVEVTLLERESQTLAEEVALLRHRVELLERVRGGEPVPPVADIGSRGHTA
ncbi:MAG TPA: DUF2304 domain-containing protein [Rugosimonospora sp.]|nr:DUF2304 domain-containing protein [Rugosimonospora sp.]